MTRSPFIPPGGEHLSAFPGAPSAPADALRVRHPAGRVGGRRPAPQQASSESDDPPLPPEKAPTATKITLSNARWERTQAAYGDTVTALVDLRLDPADAPPPRLEFICDALEPAKFSAAQSLNAAAGTVKARFTLPEAKDPDGKILPRCAFQFAVKAPGTSPALGNALEAVPGAPGGKYASVIYYNPLRDEYLMCETEEEFKSLRSEIELLEAIRGKGAAARAKDEEARRKELAALEKEAAGLFEGESVGTTEEALDELLLVRRNPRWGDVKTSVFIRSHRRAGAKVKWHTRKASDATLKKNLEELLKRAPGDKEKSPLFDRDFQAKGSFLEKNWSGQWPIAWHLKKEGSGKLAGAAYTISKEAALCRYVAGGSLDVDFSLKERKISFGGSAKVSYAVCEGRMEGVIPLPEKGINLLDYLTPIDYLDRFIEEGRECRLRLALILSAQAFVGVTASAAVALPNLDLSKAKLTSARGKRPARIKGAQVEARGSAEAFAGAQAQAGLSVAIQWSPGSDTFSFEDLAAAGLVAGASAGAGGKLEGWIAFRDGTFRFKLTAAACLGLGLKGEMSFELDIDEGCKLIGHLMHSVDYHFVGEISLEAFKAFSNYGFTLMTEGEEVLTGAVEWSGEMVSDFKSWLGGLGDSILDIKKNLGNSIRHRSSLQRISPEALAQTLATLMHTREESDFESIRLLLEAAVRPGADVKKDPSTNHKLKCMLRLLSGVDIPKAGEGREPAKKMALEKGMQRLIDFGRGNGYLDQFGKKSSSNPTFIGQLQGIFSRYGIQP